MYCTYKVSQYWGRKRFLKNFLALTLIWTDQNLNPSVLIIVADPDPKDLHHFARSESEIYSTNPDPDMNITHFPHPSPPPSHRIFHPSTSLTPPPFLLPNPLPLLPHLSPPAHLGLWGPCEHLKIWFFSLVVYSSNYHLKI